jgi:hypothetical protein
MLLPNVKLGFQPSLENTHQEQEIISIKHILKAIIRLKHKRQENINTVGFVGKPG